MGGWEGGCQQIFSPLPPPAKTQVCKKKHYSKCFPLKKLRAAQLCAARSKKKQKKRSEMASRNGTQTGWWDELLAPHRKTLIYSETFERSAFKYARDILWNPETRNGKALIVIAKKTGALYIFFISILEVAIWLCKLNFSLEYFHFLKIFLSKAQNWRKPGNFRISLKTL